MNQFDTRSFDEILATPMTELEELETRGDWEFLCYLNGLPYGYFKQAV